MEGVSFFFMKWSVQANPVWDLDFSLSGRIQEMIPKLLIKARLFGRRLYLTFDHHTFPSLLFIHPQPLITPFNANFSFRLIDFQFSAWFLLVCFTHPASSRVTLPMNLVVLSLYNSPAFADDSLSIPKHSWVTPACITQGLLLILNL